MNTPMTIRVLDTAKWTAPSNYVGFEKDFTLSLEEEGDRFFLRAQVGSTYYEDRLEVKKPTDGHKLEDHLPHGYLHGVSGGLKGARLVARLAGLKPVVPSNYRPNDEEESVRKWYVDHCEEVRLDREREFVDSAIVGV